MSFIDIFKPKWRHSDPSVRKRAVFVISELRQDILTRVVIEDSDPDVRAAALARIVDCAALHTIEGRSTDPAILGVARDKIRQAEAHALAARAKAEKEREAAEARALAARAKAEKQHKAQESRAALQRQISAAIKGNDFHLASRLIASAETPGILDGKESLLLDFPFLMTASADQVRWLLQHGASPNVSDATGKTPLHTVASAQYCLSATICEISPVEILSMLLQAGADPCAKDGSGKTPVEGLRDAPAGIGSVAAHAAEYAGGASRLSAGAISVLGDSLSQTQLMTSMLESCATAPKPREFAETAAHRATKATIPFIMVGAVIRAIMDTLRQNYPTTSVSDVVRETMSAIKFACPKCGPLNRELFALAVSARWVEEMNAGLTPIFAGPNVAAVFKGWCPACLGAAVEVSFDPRRLSFAGRAH